MMKTLKRGKVQIDQACQRIWTKVTTNQKGGLGAIGGGIILLLVVGYVAFTNRGVVSTFFANMWTYIEGKIKTIFT